jgi:hypothetical protein
MNAGNRWDRRRGWRLNPRLDLDVDARRIVWSLYWTLVLLAALALGAVWLFLPPA